MTITRDQAQMLAALATACRPNGARRWDTAGIMAALAKVADRSLPEVVMATIRAASDRDVDNPGVIPSAGSHWAEAASVRAYVPDTAPPGTRCTVCGRPESAHGAMDGICFQYMRPQPKLDPEAVTAHIAALKAELAPTAGPTERRTLEDLAAANPELHARVEAVRAANPGLATLPLQEPEPPVAHPDAELPPETEEKP